MSVSPPERPPAIHCAGLVKRFGEVTAVAGLDLTVQAGECFGLLGPNGAGKTTTIEILEGLTPADTGEVQVLGHRWDGGAGDRLLRQRLGIQLQETKLPEKLTVAETIRLFASFYPQPQTVETVLDLVELGEKRKAWYSKLSGGQKQRLAVACALVNRPELLFLDEPTTGLDPQSRRQLWDVIAGFRSAGNTVLLTTHYMEEAEQLCDRVAIIDHGKILEIGAVDELISRHFSERTLRFRSRAEISDSQLASLRDVSHVNHEEDEVVLYTSNVPRTIAALLELAEAAGADDLDVVVRRPTLEDVFLELTGRALRD
jgi:ABC-2 type transport system ATP-binding protein